MSAPLAASARAAFEEFIRTRTGLVWTPGRRAHLVALIEKAMARAGITDIDRFLARLRGDTRLLNELADELTVRETYFMRDRQQFSFVCRDVLPAIQRQRAPGHALRIWSAGCASGEEPYSLAILLDEEGLASRAQIVGTDISEAALTSARNGSYSEWSLRNSDEAFRRRYFKGSGRRFVLNAAVRERVVFQQHNLAGDVLPEQVAQWGRVDVIVLRNVLIYFDPESVRRVVAMLYDTLDEGGWLITGPSDPPVDGLAPFKTVIAPEGVFYCRCADAATLPKFPRTTNLSAPVQNLAPIFPAPNFDALLKPLPAIRPPLVQPAGPKIPASPSKDALAEARAAFERGAYADAIVLAEARGDLAPASVLRVYALANLKGAAAAEEACSLALRRHKLSAELHYLHAMLLQELGRREDAMHALRRVILIDRSLAAAHFALGNLLRFAGDSAKARRAYQNVLELCRKRSATEAVPLADGGEAGGMADAAAAQLALLNGEDAE